MGVDIHGFVEVRNKETNRFDKVENCFELDEYSKKALGTEKGSNPFDWRSYSMFAFLAGVKNYDNCEPLSEPKGFPSDSEYLEEEIDDDKVVYTRKESIQDNGNYYSFTYLYLKELVEFDYEKTFWNRRVTKETSPNVFDGAGLADEGEGVIISYRENLGGAFFKVIEELKMLGSPEDVRVVLWFG